MNPFGWPQLVVYCMGQSSSGHEFVKAYGSIHVPVTPGVHNKQIRMFSPLETGTIAEFFGINRESEGLSTQISNPQAIANPDGRQYSRVMATGKIAVSLNITQRNLGRHGYLVSDK